MTRGTAGLRVIWTQRPYSPKRLVSRIFRPQFLTVKGMEAGDVKTGWFDRLGQKAMAGASVWTASNHILVNACLYAMNLAYQCYLYWDSLARISGTQRE